jgi:hypothetical protein
MFGFPTGRRLELEVVPAGARFCHLFCADRTMPPTRRAEITLNAPQLAAL